MANNVVTPYWADLIIAAHTNVAGANVSHAGRMKSSRYFVWQEDENRDLSADNIHAEESVSGYTDLFTKIEFDPWGRQLGQEFDRLGIAWEKSGVTYEADTGFFHHTWEWVVT